MSILLNKSTLFCCFEMPPLDSEFLFILVFASRHSILVYICFFSSYSHRSSPLGLRSFCSLISDSQVIWNFSRSWLEVIRFLYYSMWSHFYYESSKKFLDVFMLLQVPHIYPFNHFHGKHRLFKKNRLEIRRIVDSSARIID